MRDVPAQRICAGTSRIGLHRDGHESSLSVLRALADSLDVRPDQLILYAAGLPMSDDEVSTEDAIRGDKRLTAEQRSAPLAVLSSCVEANAAAQRS